MIRLLQIIFYTGLAAILTSCGPAGDDTQIWQDTKITDLATIKPDKGPGSLSPKSMDFDIWILEIPAENYKVSDVLSQSSPGQRLQFNDYDTFTANPFSVGFGRPIWSKKAGPAAASLVWTRIGWRSTKNPSGFLLPRIMKPTAICCGKFLKS